MPKFRRKLMLQIFTVESTLM